MFNISMSTLKPFFVGFLLGILVIAGGLGIFAKTVYDGTVNNYGDEATGLISLLEDAKDPVLQKDYVITGLILSDEFNEFLEQGVEEGRWTEDFLLQFAADYSLPILIKNYMDVIGLVASTDQAKEIAEKVSKLMDILVKVKLQLEVMAPEIQGLIAKLKDPDLKEKAIEQIKEKLLTILENAGALDVLANIINKVDVIKFKVKGTVESFMRLLDDLKDPNLKAELVSKVKTLVSEKLASLGILDTVKELIQNIKDGIDLSTIKGNIIEKIEVVLSEVITQVEAVVQAKIQQVMANLDLSGLKDQLVARLLELKDGITDELAAKLSALIASLDISGLKDQLMAEIIAHKDEIIAAVLAQVGTNKDEIIDALINLIVANLNLDAIDQAIENIQVIIGRLEDLAEQMPEIQDQINAIVENFNNLIEILNNINFDDINATIDAIIEQLDAIFATIDEIAQVLGDASAVIDIIVSTEDVEKDNWEFIPALKAYDDSLSLINLPTSLYKKLNMLEPIINILSLDIVYTYTPDDGNILNGNSATLDVTAVNVGKEGSDKYENILDGPINLGGMIANTVSGFLPIISDNI